MNRRTRINLEIRAPELRVLLADGTNLGILSFREAYAKATEMGLDLIEISESAIPPIAKIMDFGKYQYMENKKQKEVKAKTHVQETKNIQVRIGTGDHDLEQKATNTDKFLGEGHRVKIELYLRGRAKYMDQKFLRERLERMLTFVKTPFKIMDEIKPSPKGLSVMIERRK